MLKNVKKCQKFKNISDGRTDGRTDGWIDGRTDLPTDTASSRVALHVTKNVVFYIKMNQVESVNNLFFYTVTELEIHVRDRS